MAKARLTRAQRERAFGAELKLAGVLRSLWNRMDRTLPEEEKRGMGEACAIVWTLYRVAKKGGECA